MNELFNISTAQVEATSRKEWLKNRRTAKASITISGGSSMPNTSSSTPTAPTLEKLSDLLDVSLTEPKKGDVLQHDGTEWKNSPLSNAIGGNYYTKEEIDNPLYGYVKRSEGGIIHEPIDVRGDNSQVIVRSNYNDEYAVAEVVGAKVSEGVMGRLRWSPGQTDLTGEGDLYYNGKKVALGNGGGSGDGGYVSKRGDEMLGKLSIQASDTQLILIGEQNDAGDYRAQIIAESTGERYGGISWSRNFTNIFGESGHLTYNDEPLATLIDVNDIVNQIQGGGGLVEKTYAEVKALRDSGQLVAGQFYRITDYVTTTKEVDTASANHPFDIITFAIDSSHLCEECWAAVHSGDKYFANSDLNSWRVWYTLDNDTTRYGWADKTNGKGVIYRLIDNFGNDCPYDFKNIMFRRYYVSSGNFHDRFGGKYFGIKHLGMLFPDGSTIDQKDSGTAFFTFSEYIDGDQIDTPADLSRGNYAGNHVFGNIIKPLYDGRTQRLNNIVFAGSGCYGNVIGSNCQSMTFHRCCENSIGAECGVFCFDESNYNDIGATCSGVDFAYSDRNSVSHSNNYIAMSMSSHNVVGAFCETISFADNCFSNRVGDNNHYVVFYRSNRSNTLGNNCWSVGFNPSSHHNHLGDMMIYVNISGEDNTLEGCSQWLNAGHEDDPCIGRWIRKYNSCVDTTGIRAGYFDGFEARVKLVYNDPECRIIGYDNEFATIEFSPWEVYDPAGTITDGVVSWLCTCYEMGGYLGYSEVEVEVSSNGRTNSFEIELPVEDLDGFMENEEFELEITMVPVGDNGEWLYGYTPDGNPEEEIIYTYAYVAK